MCFYSRAVRFIEAFPPALTNWLYRAIPPKDIIMKVVALREKSSQNRSLWYSFQEDFILNI